MKTISLALLKIFLRMRLPASNRSGMPFPSENKRLTLYYIVASLCFLLISPATFAQWVPGYTYKSQVTIHGSQVCGPGTHTNFPILIQLSGAFLTPSPTGLITNTNGYDIIFTASDGTTILNHQIDHYNSSTGEFSAWVKIPSLVPGVDQNLFMYYGNSSITTDPSVQTTWSGNFNTVYHFENNNFNDATANAINSTNNGTNNITAKIGEGRDLDGTAAYIQSSSTALTTINNFTMSVWFKADVLTPGHILWQGAVTENGWGNGGAGGQEMNLSMGTCCPGGTAPGSFISYFLGDREEQLSPDVLNAEQPFTNTTDWQYAAVTVRDLDTAPVAELFLNGTSIAVNTGVAGTFTARDLWNTNFRIGRPGAATRFFNGQVDEVRIADAARSADWICTEYNNQNNPGGFFALVNHAPDLTSIEVAALAYSEGAAETVVTSSLAAGDWDNATFSSASIRISGNYANGEDVLAFADALGITGSWDATTGTLTLTGTATISDYQLALRAVTYQNTNNINPSTLARTITFTVNDGTDNSNNVTRNINLTGVNDAPVVADTEAAALAYSEGQAATAITSLTTVVDGDNANLTTATVRITSNYVSTEDILAFTNAFGITGTFNTTTGTMTLTGTSSVSNYEAALRSVTYRNSNNNTPSAAIRVVTFIVSDGSLASSAVTRSIAVAPVNDPPVLAAMEATAITFTEGAAAAIITGLTTVADVDNSTNLTGATVQITGNFVSTEDILTFTNAFSITGSYDATTGIMTLTGTTTPANYQSAIRSIRYQNTNGGNPSAATRTVSFTVTDGTDNSNTVTRNINITGVNDAPVIAGIEATTLSYSEGQAAAAITSTITVTDVDNANIASATVQISTAFSSGQDVLAFTPAFGIAASFNTTTGLLTLTGAASIADYQTALQSVTYVNTNNNNPSTTTRVVTFRVNDGALNSNTVTRNITFTAVNDAPVLAATEATALTFTEGAAATAITGATTVTDVDNATNVTGATIQITGNFIGTEDVLTFTNAFSITGSYNATTGTMTLTGTTNPGNYQSAIRAVRYQNTNGADPSAATRTVSFTVTDGTDNSNMVTRNINVVPVNDLPVLSTIDGAAIAYTEGQTPTAVTSTLTVADIDNPTLANATVQITSNYSTGQDVLAFADAMGITSAYNSTTGLLTLTGPASIADFQTAFRSVTYENTNNANPSALTRTLTFRINDGTGSSNSLTRQILFTAVNDAPALSAIETTDLAYNEGDAATIITLTTATTDGDNPNLQGAIVQITGNFLNPEDILSFTNAFGISGSYNALTGILTLSGNQPFGNYQSALRTVRYRNSNNATPSPLTRTVSFTVRDAALNSNTVTRNITIAPINDPPTVVNDAGTTPEETAITINVLANDTDMDDTIDPLTVAVVTNPVNGAVSVDATTGAITYTPNLNFSGTNTFTYTVKDAAGSTSNPATVTITVTNINDPPTFTKGADIVVSEDAGPQTISGWATAMDDGDPFTTQTLSFVIVSNSNTGLFSTAPTVNASTGNLTFRSNNNAAGIATITIALRDNGSNVAPNVYQSASQTFTITVTALNDPPNAVADFYSTSSNTAVTANVRSNDTDPESNTLTVSTTPAVAPAFGTVVISSNGNFTYTPDGSFTGTDTFTYEICDNGTDNGVPASRCSQAVVSITINPPNAIYNIVGNNSIQISEHCFILTKALNNQQGAVWNRFPLDLRYSFELNFTAIFSEAGTSHDVGADGIIFAIQRDDTPPPLNDPGSPIDARGSVGEYLGIGGVSPSIGIEVDTYQNAGEPVFDHIAISKNGSVYDIIAPAVAAKVDGSNNPLDIEDGVDHTVRIAWDKPTNTLRVYFDGVERTNFTQDIINTIFGGDPTNVYWGFSSSTGGQNNYQGVCGIDMLPINLPAIAVNDNVSTDEDLALTATVLTNDSDPEAGALTVVPETKTTTHGDVVINANGTFTYTPAADYFGSDSFTYQTCDGFTTPGCATATVNINVLPTSDNPVSVADAYTTNEDTPLTIAATGVLVNDTDADGDAITSVLDATTTNGTLTFNADGSFTYTPAANFNGSDSFTYHSNDGVNNSTTVTVSLTINPINDAPVAVNDGPTTPEDVAISIDVITNDTDVDNALTPGAVAIIGNPTHGTVSVNTTTGAVTYTPAANYNGNDSFTYTVNDVSGATSNPATVYISITAVNDPPTAANETVVATEDTPLTITVLANDTDIDNAIDATSVVAGNAAHGTISVNAATGVITYTPEQDYNGSDSFTYTVKDASGSISNAATVAITVTPVNDAPVAAADDVTVIQNTSVGVNVLANDSDVDDAIDPASIVVVVNPSHGTLSINTTTGAVTYTPDTDYLGGDTFSYTVSDASGDASNTATVNVLVNPPNQPPVAINDALVHASLLPVTIDVLANDSDPDNALNELTLTSVTQPNVGSVSIVDGKVVYQPAGTEAVIVTFTYTIRDPEGLTSTATVTIDYAYEPLAVSQGFSPNGDNNNDNWFIRSIDSYPDNSVKVFDRWGILVYQIRHYDNESVFWDGRANTGLESGKLLERGTYYFLVDLGNNTKTMSGYVTIVR